MLAVAEVESAGRMREIARVIAARIDPEASARRRKAALRGRDVRAIDLDDGMARLLADLPAPLVHAIMDRLNRVRPHRRRRPAARAQAERPACRREPSPSWMPDSTDAEADADARAAAHAR